MAANQQNSSVGDKNAPALNQNAESLRCGVNQGVNIPANCASPAKPVNKAANLGTALSNKANEPAHTDCVQKIWFSFFFDGTGNNMDADLGTLKHSNVVRLYRAHSGTDPYRDKPKISPDGNYRLYIPGVGTYFKEVHDDSASTSGLAFALMGDRRLAWAKDQFDLAMKPHFARAQNPQNYIVEINISAFGFSRGAAEARAFISRFVLQSCDMDKNNKLKLKQGGYPVYIRFMGLFDTVASVGQPLSSNNVSIGDLVFGSSQMASRENSGSRPKYLAFSEYSQLPGTAGADPAPGIFNGHISWGAEMAIPHVVEEVRHFVAAHENRNSFPVDSVTVLTNNRFEKPAQFFETVYPGVHSDVGGSYRPGEEAKSEKSELKIGLIALSDMYNFAMAKGVPLMPRTNWKNENNQDFNVDQKTYDVYNYYLSKIPSSSSLGALFNANMALYYAWRFRSIHRKQQNDTTEARNNARNDAVFQSDAEAKDKEIATLTQQNDAAKRQVTQANSALDYQVNHALLDPNRKNNLATAQQNVSDAQAKQAVTQDNLLRAQAQKDALPGVGVEKAINMYDKQLIADAEAIYSVYGVPQLGSPTPDSKWRNYLRPHYKAMMDAYENEYIHNKGLTDPKIIDFFDNYVHDSLAGFAKDATMPSDPRVIYLGGSEKYQYAMNTPDKNTPDNSGQWEA